MKTRAYRVTTKGFEPLSHDEFWEAITAPPDDDPLRRPMRGRRRPWQK